MYQVLKFSAERCGPCKAFKGTRDKTKALKDQNVEFIEYDIDKHEDETLWYEIRVVPTLIFLSDDKVVDKKVGNFASSMSEDEFMKWIEYCEEKSRSNDSTIP